MRLLDSFILILNDTTIKMAKKIQSFIQTWIISLGFGSWLPLTSWLLTLGDFFNQPAYYFILYLWKYKKIQNIRHNKYPND
jgi:hypothetical protein